MTPFAIATAFWVSYVLLWCLVALLVLLIILVYRQFGLAFMRPGERIALQGLDIGSRAPDFSLTDRSGRERRISFEVGRDSGRTTAVLFAREGCHICAGLAETLVDLPSERREARFVWVDGSSSPPHRAIEDAPGWLYGSARDDRVHRQWEVSAVPFCFVVAPDGRIADKRLLNRRVELEGALGIRAAHESPTSKELIS